MHDLTQKEALSVIEVESSWVGTKSTGVSLQMRSSSRGVVPPWLPSVL